MRNAIATRCCWPTPPAFRAGDVGLRATLAPCRRRRARILSGMFRWCAYCQRLIGEREPFARYEVTHGICPRCEKNVDTYVSEQSTIVARDLFSELTRIGTS